MKCPKCNTENPQEAKFCSSCGNDLSQIKNLNIPKENIETPKNQKKAKIKKIIITLVALIVLCVGVFLMKQEIQHNARIEAYEIRHNDAKNLIKIKNEKIVKENTNDAIFERNKTYNYYFVCDVINPTSENFGDLFALTITVKTTSGATFTVKESVIKEQTHIVYKLDDIFSDPGSIVDLQLNVY